MKRSLIIVLLFGCFMHNLYGESKGYSSHFDGKKFHNATLGPHWGFFDVLKWRFTSNKKPWPQMTETRPGPKPPADAEEGNIHVTFVNHSTVLIQWNDINILTDPIWSDRCSPFSWIGPKRSHAPGILFKDLPRIDLVLISHDHYDHLDLPTLKDLKDQDDPLMITGLGNGKFLKNNGLENVIELDWWDEHKISDKFKIVFVPAQHFSGRGLFDRDETLWGGFVIESNDGTQVFFRERYQQKQFVDSLENYQLHFYSP